MEGAQVKDVIQKWRLLTSSVKEKSKELEKAREALHQLDTEHSKTVRQWELEKESIKGTIGAILEQVRVKRDELQRIEHDTADLNRKVVERQRRNVEHLTVLNRRRDVVQTQLKEAEEKDAGVRDRLSTFRRMRDAGRDELLAAIQKAEIAIPRETEAFQQRVRQLQSKMSDIVANTEAEAQSWALEQAMRSWKDKTEARQRLVDEISAAEHGKDVWAEMLHEANTLNNQDSMRLLSEVQSIISSSS